MSPLIPHRPVSPTETFVSDLLISPPAPLSTQLPTQPQASPAEPPAHVLTFPRLDSHSQKFLGLTPLEAGRAVLIELWQPKYVSPEDIEHLMEKHDADTEEELGERMNIFREGTPPQNVWKRYVGKIPFQDLGRSAQRLERAGFNWRQAITWKQIIQEAQKLPPETLTN